MLTHTIFVINTVALVLTGLFSTVWILNVILFAVDSIRKGETTLTLKRLKVITTFFILSAIALISVFATLLALPVLPVEGVILMCIFGGMAGWTISALETLRKKKVWTPKATPRKILLYLLFTEALAITNVVYWTYLMTKVLKSIGTLIS